MKKSKNFQSQQVMLRPFSYDDLADVLEYASQEDVARLANFTVCRTPAQGRLFLESMMSRQLMAIVLVPQNKVIGNIGLYEEIDQDGGPSETRAEIGYAINHDFWNQGYGTQALKLMLELAKKKQYKGIDAKVLDNNTASKMILEKNGFIRKGTITPLYQGSRQILFSNKIKD